MSKYIQWLILGAIVVLIITHPAGFAGDATAASSFTTGVLSIESGANATGGVKGTVGGNTFS
jgi:hypothetical protein